MKFFFLDKILKLVSGRLDGHKTKIGGVIAILTGLGSALAGLTAILLTYFPQEAMPPPADLETAWTLIVGGFGGISYGFSTLGNGGKQEKLRTEIQRLTDGSKGDS